jgi:(p)ppGpp synthase/HD superfamily hydrolase
MSQIIIVAARTVMEFHGSQMRRGPKPEPYVFHCLEVGEILARHHAPDVVVAAGICHDTFEDTDITYDILCSRIGQVGAEMVIDVSDVYTKKMFPEFNWEERKEREHKRLSGICRDSKGIKCADIISNAQSIVRNDPGFARSYLEMMEKLLPMLGREQSYPLLWDEAQRVVATAQTDLVRLQLGRGFAKT